MTVTGWTCIAAAGLQLSVFAGSFAWSFKSGRDLATHQAKIRRVERQIEKLDEKILRKQATPEAQRRFADQDIEARQDFRPARPAMARRDDPDETAREKLRGEMLDLRMSMPSEFTLAAASAMVTGFAVLLFWLAATSGLLAGSLGCLLLRLTAR